MAIHYLKKTKEELVEALNNHIDAFNLEIEPKIDDRLIDAEKFFAMDVNYNSDPKRMLRDSIILTLEIIDKYFKAILDDIIPIEISKKNKEQIIEEKITSMFNSATEALRKKYLDGIPQGEEKYNILKVVLDSFQIQTCVYIKQQYLKKLRVMLIAKKINRNFDILKYLIAVLVGAIITLLFSYIS